MLFFFFFRFESSLIFLEKKRLEENFKIRNYSIFSFFLFEKKEEEEINEGKIFLGRKSYSIIFEARSTFFLFLFSRNLSNKFIRIGKLLEGARP